LNAVLHLDDAIDPFDQGSDLLRLAIEHGWVGRVELDFDRLRDGGQIADQILDELCDLDLDAWHLDPDLVGDAGGHLLGRAAVVRLQPDEIVAVIALAEIATEAGAEPPGEGQHLRIGPQQLVDLTDLTPAFVKRGAGSGVVIHDEAAFVDLRHEACRHLGIADIADRQERDEDDKEQPRSG